MKLRTLFANWVCNVDGESDDEKDERDGDEEILITEPIQGKDPDFLPYVWSFFPFKSNILKTSLHTHRVKYFCLPIISLFVFDPLLFLIQSCLSFLNSKVIFYKLLKIYFLNWWCKSEHYLLLILWFFFTTLQKNGPVFKIYFKYVFMIYIYHCCCKCNVELALYYMFANKQN